MTRPWPLSQAVHTTLTQPHSLRSTCTHLCLLSGCGPHVSGLRRFSCLRTKGCASAQLLSSRSSHPARPAFQVAQCVANSESVETCLLSFRHTHLNTCDSSDRPHTPLTITPHRSQKPPLMCPAVTSHHEHVGQRCHQALFSGALCLNANTVHGSAAIPNRYRSRTCTRIVHSCTALHGLTSHCNHPPFPCAIAPTCTPSPNGLRHPGAPFVCHPSGPHQGPQQPHQGPHRLPQFIMQWQHAMRRWSLQLLLLHLGVHSTVFFLGWKA